MKQAALFIIIAILLAVPALAQLPVEDVDVDLILFYGKGCPHCGAEEKFLVEMKDKYPLLTVHEYEVYFNQTSRELMQKMAAAYGTEVGGVPTTFINGKVITGFSDSLGKSIEQEIQNCIENMCKNPLDRLAQGNDQETVIISGSKSPAENPVKTTTTEGLTIGAVIAAAAVDAINPCAFAVLILLLTAILGAGNRKRSLFAGLAFSTAVYISYLLMGLGLFTAITAAGVTHTFYTVVAVLAIIVGLFNLKDYLWYGKWFKMEVPDRWRPKMKMLLKSVTSVPGAFFVGFLISLFLLPCTSGPYIVILGLLAKTATRDYAMIMLMLYNFIFVLPMLAITFAIYFGFTSTAKAEEWRQRKLTVLHLIAGGLMVLLGTGMFVAMWLGMV